MDKKLDDFVNVSVRIRPTSPSISNTSSVEVISADPPVLVLVDRTFHFDNIFTKEHDQEVIYNETVRPLVEHVKTGYNCTVFAYGQTGTGKTHTIGTDPDVKGEHNIGLISRALEEFFNITDEDTELEICISFIEIYNEKVFDLLGANNNMPLPVKGFQVQGFTKEKVFSTYDAQTFLKTGGKNRHTGETRQNAKSSRSHAIFTIYCQVRTHGGQTMAKLNLVDLAGSESVRKTGNNQGNSFQEGININKGLLSLGQVMMALSTNSGHVPYRQSIITTILQDSLNKRNFISLIACLSSNPEDVGETQQTLEFANRVKKMRNKPEVNKIISRYRRNNPTIFGGTSSSRLTPLKRSAGNTSYETPFKKPRSFLPMNPIFEPSHALNSPKSVLSMSMNSNSSSVAQQNLSPIIKKYMDAMENSLMTKLEKIIENSVQRPILTRSRRSSMRNKENCATPTLPWEKINNQISTMVRSEVLQLTSQITRRATSTPLELSLVDDNIDDNENASKQQVVGRKLFEMQNEDISLDAVEGGNIVVIDELVDARVDDQEEEAIFKIPAPKKIADSKVARRSSMRLQLKKLPEESPMPIWNNMGNNSRRTSVRLAIKKSVKVEESLPKKKLKKGISSPIASHHKDVLRILNSGSLKDLQKLHTVGPKTAEMIKFFRKICGRFTSIADLSEMPQWSQAKYERFLTQNFLKC